MKFKFHIVSILILFLNSFLKAQTTNIDFELTSPGVYTASNSVSGWNLSSQNTSTCPLPGVWISGSSEFSVVATPVLSSPIIGNLGNSPLGGSNVARLNNATANTSLTRLDRTFTVNPTNSLFQFAFAGVWEDGGHSTFLCDQTGFVVQIKDQTGNILSCFTQSLIPGPGGQTAGLSYSVTSGSYWCNWQVKYIDLSAYLNTSVTIEIICKDCRFGDHYGTLFFDSKLTNSYGPDIGSGLSIISINPQSPVNFCAGSNIATMCGPLGYSTYSWIAPAGAPPTSTSVSSPNCATISNPVANSVYTLMTTVTSGCIYLLTYILSPTQVSITTLGSQPSCVGGSSGSASVVACGSGAGYNYSWVNSTSSVVSNYSSAVNLGPGVYTIHVSAAGSASSTCGNANATVSIGTATSSVISLLKPYCGSGCAYLSYPGGSNYQWYSGLSAITASLGGTASSYTACTPANGSIYRLSYISSQGCHDSLQITLLASIPGSLGVTYNPITCAGASNGTAVLAMLPVAGATPGSNSYSVFSTGTTSAYTASINSTAANNFTVNNLSAGGTYSVIASDGSCNYSTNFSVTPYTFNYTLSPSNSPTLCPGNSIAASISFTSPPSLTQYTYSWSPTTFLAGGMGNFQNTIVTPTAIAGSTTTVIYTVVVTPSLVNCPLTKTLCITSINPATPTINPIPPLCTNSSVFTISASPGGGTYTPSSGINYNGIITPTLCLIGINSFTYTPPAQGTCVANSATGSFVINYHPYIAYSGNLTICNGQTSTLSLSGNSSTYTWSTGSNSSFIVVSPTVTTSYTVVGTGTNGCLSYPMVLTTTVVPIPTLSISGNNVCVNSSGTLQASGASTYSWSNGSIGSSITVPPNAGTIYTVTGANSQTCISSSTVQLSTVNPPTLSVSGNTQICKGQSTTLLANGASTYTWSNGVLSPFTAVNPSLSSEYIVSGSDAFNSCLATKHITVTVLPVPNLIISGDTLLCSGESTTLTASGADIYNWSNGSLNSNISVAPNVTTVYTLQGTNTAGSCSSSKLIMVNVNSCTDLSTPRPSGVSISVYPNPTSGDLTLDIQLETMIQFVNTTGEIALRKRYLPGKHTLNVHTLPAGIYLLEVRTLETTQILKILKNN